MYVERRPAGYLGRLSAPLVQRRNGARAAYQQRPARSNANVVGSITAVSSKNRTESAVATYLYVDNSNVWIEGMHVSAVAKGLAPDIRTAQEQKICDHGWSYDFGKLLKFAGGEREDIGRAVL